MKHLTSLLLFVLLAQGSIKAQQTRDWIKIAPADERFELLMPQIPRLETAELNYMSNSGPRDTSGIVYSAAFEGSTYRLWSLETSRAPRNLVDEIQFFLDDYAQFVWEVVLKPARGANSKPTEARMVYKSELAMGVIPGREYSLTIGNESGASRFYMDGNRLYVLVALKTGGDVAGIQKFFSSFRAKSPTDTPFLPVPATLDADPVSQVFAPSETTTRAKVLSKPEPQYTEAARKYSVTGAIVLRGVISPDGRLTNIQILRRLPHGLTEAAVAAAKQIKFTPAVKDGLTVSQSIQLEYNFLLY